MIINDHTAKTMVSLAQGAKNTMCHPRIALETLWEHFFRKIVTLEKMDRGNAYGQAISTPYEWFFGRENVKKYHANGAPLFARI